MQLRKLERDNQPRKLETSTSTSNARARERDIETLMDYAPAQVSVGHRWPLLPGGLSHHGCVGDATGAIRCVSAPSQTRYLGGGRLSAKGTAKAVPFGLPLDGAGRPL